MFLNWHAPVQKTGGWNKNSAANHGAHDQWDPAEKAHSSFQLQWSLCVAGKKKVIFIDI